ncbi:MAG: TRAP transporter small permease subunit, partial [candidate division NC10 bacterium]|nr:TRAP transporter small permease subunit [candidate division NC10 bacterium]
HFVVEFVVQALPAGARRAVRAAIFLLLLGVSGVFLVQGTLFARMGLDVVSPTMDVRMVWSYAAVPAGGLFMMLYSLERLLSVLQGRERA